MKLNNVKSDQLYKWSDIYERQINHHSTSKTEDSFAQASIFRGYCSRLFNRAIQALWEAWMQMCRWTRPWPKVLSVGKQAWQHATDGLCPTAFKGKGRRVPGKSSQNKGNFRRALRNQPRAITTKGKVLARPPPRIRGQPNGNVSNRCRTDSHYLCQHA